MSSQGRKCDELRLGLNHAPPSAEAHPLPSAAENLIGGTYYVTQLISQNMSQPDTDPRAALAPQARWDPPSPGKVSHQNGRGVDNVPAHTQRPREVTPPWRRAAHTPKQDVCIAGPGQLSSGRRASRGAEARFCKWQTLQHRRQLLGRGPAERASLC